MLTQIQFALFFVFLFTLTGKLHAALSLESFQKDLPELDWQSAQQGTIVHQDMPPMETEPAAIAVLFAALINGELNSVLKQLRQPINGSIAIPIDTSSDSEARAGILSSFS